MVNVWAGATGPVRDMRAVAALDSGWWDAAAFALTNRGYRLGRPRAVLPLRAGVHLSVRDNSYGRMRIFAPAPVEMGTG